MNAPPVYNPQALADVLAQALHDSTRRCDDTDALLARALLALKDTRHALASCRLAERRARRLSERDGLTGLLNRQGFQQRSGRLLARHAAQALGLGVLFIDLDGFKAVNDELGHAAGDALLTLVGARLVHALRSDDRVSRHGGDEFVCLLPQLQREDDALAIARKLQESVSAPCQLDGHTLQLRASVGIAVFPQDGKNLAQLMGAADQAMLWAKSRQLGLALASRLPPRADDAPSAASAQSGPAQEASRAGSKRSYSFFTTA